MATSKKVFCGRYRVKNFLRVHHSYIDLMISFCVLKRKALNGAIQAAVYDKLWAYHEFMVIQPQRKA
jgi:hypothetical protein